LHRNAVFARSDLTNQQAIGATGGPLQEILNRSSMRLIFCFFLLVCNSHSFAQMQTPAGCDQLRMAANTLCRGDTIGALRIIDDITRDYPVDGLSAVSCLAAGRLYLAQQKEFEARRILLIGLDASPRLVCTIPIDSSCRTVLHNYWNARAKAEICILLGKIASEQFQPALALQYLYLADSTWLPYRYCANGMQQYQGELSLLIADQYFKMGDTVKAMQRLFDFLPYEPAIAGLLKRRLRAVYTQNQIRTEFRHAINNTSGTDNQGEFIVTGFFGYPVKWYFGIGESPKEKRRWLRRSPFIHTFLE